MVRIRQASGGSYSNPAQDKDNRGQKDRQNLKPYVESQRPSRVSTVETHYQNSSRDNSEERNCRNDSVSSDKVAVLGLLCETVSHTY